MCFLKLKRSPKCLEQNTGKCNSANEQTNKISFAFYQIFDKDAGVCKLHKRFPALEGEEGTRGYR